MNKYFLTHWNYNQISCYCVQKEHFEHMLHIPHLSINSVKLGTKEDEEKIEV